VFRLAWDFVGTGLGSRNAQYERFYLASGARNLQRAFTVADKDRADRLVDRFLPDAGEG
jgi:4-hydroxyphenylacetate 3-monooxygenase